ncbi:MAG: sulfatase [Chloroflexota bacterium]
MSQPNVLFIFSDQQRYSALGCSDNPIVKTPNIDALAEQGVVLDNAFSSCPICGPYRGQLMTGKYSHANGVVDNEYGLYPNQDTLPRAFGAAGYKTAYVGKWHLGYGPYAPEDREGFDTLIANNCDHDHNDIYLYDNENGPIRSEKWGPTWETDIAMQWMEEHVAENPQQPFGLLLSWGPPHWTGHVYDQYPNEFDTYDPATLDLPPNVPPQLEAFARQELAHYYGNVTALDHEVGRLMATLEQLNIAEDTIICYTSDHGDHLSSHGYGKPFDNWLHYSKRASKATPFDESIHVPFVVRYPNKIRAGERSDILFSSVDIMPTLLGLAGVTCPDGVQGQDLSAALLGEDGLTTDSVYLQILGPGWPKRGDWVGFWRGVRTERWVYARWLGGKDIWLFDREADPYEMKNLAGQEAYTDIQATLEDRLQQWVKETGDPFESGERDLETGMLNLGQKLTKAY